MLMSADNDAKFDSARGQAGRMTALPSRPTIPGRRAPSRLAESAQLLGAVKARLATNAAQAPAVIDCVRDLDRLQAALGREFDRLERLELDLQDAQAALALTSIELAGTRAGERRARHQSLHDSLTLLPNRSCFRQRLDGALELDGSLRRPLAVLYLDLDDFKPVNDTHGHEAGDELLRIVAARLARAVRRGDMVCRLGGDEFACLLADLPGREQLCHLACKLFDAVSAPVRIGRLELSVRPSIGIAICPTDGDTADALLRSADTAMYAAKRERTGYAFCDGMRTT
jgi:diguanylate cyclase